MCESAFWKIFCNKEDFVVGGDSLPPPPPPPLPSPDTYCSLVHVHAGCSPKKVEKERVARWTPKAVNIESSEAVGGGHKMV